MDSRRFYCARAIAYACCAKRSHAAPAFVPLNCLCERPPAVPCAATVHVGVGTCITSRNVKPTCPSCCFLVPHLGQDEWPVAQNEHVPALPQTARRFATRRRRARTRAHLQLLGGPRQKQTAWARDRTVRVMTVCLRPRARSTRQRGDWAGTPTFVTPWNNGREQSPEAVRGGSPRRERVSALMRTRAPRGQGVA